MASNAYLVLKDFVLRMDADVAMGIATDKYSDYEDFDFRSYCDVGPRDAMPDDVVKKGFLALLTHCEDDRISNDDALDSIDELITWLGYHGHADEPATQELQAWYDAQ